MPNSKYKIFRIMEKIRLSLLQTRMYLETYQFLNDQRSTHPYQIFPTFFQIASDASLREAILGITRLTDENQESINFKLLLDMAENHARLLRHSPVDVRTLVETNRLRLSGLDPLLRALRPFRDRELAHLDRKHLNDPSAISPEPIQLQDLFHSLDILLVILADIWQALLDVPIPEDQAEGLLVKELDTLWMMIEKYPKKVGESE